MSYVDRVIQPGEVLVYRAALHWVLYLPSVSTVIVGAAIAIAGWWSGGSSANGGLAALRFAILGVGVIVLCAGLLALAGAFIRRHSTEVAVTSKRVIYKTGIIRRLTSELSVEKIETVLVEQGLLGRLLNYGTVIVRGTGGGLEPVANIEDPLSFRSKLTVR
jgi:uncharacterized membrane protein YdbT with pleckstrin-like domain